MKYENFEEAKKLVHEIEQTEGELNRLYEADGPFKVMVYANDKYRTTIAEGEEIRAPRLRVFLDGVRSDLQQRIKELKDELEKL